MTETTNIGALVGTTSTNRRRPMGAETPTDVLGVPQAMSTEDAEADSNDGEQHDCPSCERCFNTRRGLGIHHQSAHGIGIRAYEVQEADKSTKCPTCGDILPSEYGMKIHHAKVHDESIAGVSVYCEQCGEVAKRLSPSHAKRTNNHFCSDRCHSDYENGGRIERTYGVSPGGLLHTLHWEQNLSVNLISDIFDVHHTQVARWMEYRGVERRSQSAAERHKWARMTDEQRKQQVRAAHARTRKIAEAGEHHWQLDNPTLLGYGAGWTEEKRELVREMYDRTCQACGSPPQPGYRLDVHHIIPAGYFDDPERRNAVDNLVALCRSCHRRWEGIPLRPQLVD